MLQALLQRESLGRNQMNSIIRTGSTHITYMLLFAGINIHIIFTGIFAYNLALVNLLAGRNIENTTLLTFINTISGSITGFKSYQRASGSARNISFIRSPISKYMVHNAIALSIGQQLVSKTDKTTSRNNEFHT